MENVAATPEMWTVIAGFVALAGLLVGGQMATGRRLERIEARLGGRIAAVESALEKQSERIDRQGEKIEALGQRVAAAGNALERQGERIAAVENTLERQGAILGERIDKQGEKIEALGERAAAVEGALKVVADFLTGRQAA